MTDNFLFLIIIMLVGLALHVAMKWQQARRDHAEDPQHPSLTIKQYLQLAPAQTSVATLAALGTFLVAISFDVLNGSMAFSCGYIGSSLAQNIAGTFKAGGA